MKKILFFMLLISFSLNAQHRYKVEYDIELSSPGEDAEDQMSDFEVNLVFFNPNQQSYNVYNESATGVDEVINKSFNNIIELNGEVTKIQIDSNASVEGGSCGTYLSEMFDLVDGCFFILEEDDYPSSCGTAFIRYFKVYKILNLIDVNNFNPTNNEIKECESKTINISDCTFISSYAVDYSLGASASWQELLPYGDRANSFDISFIDFTGVQLNENINIRVRYINDTSPIYSDILTYKFASCSPQLLSFTPTDAQCSYTDDGSFNMILDRDLESGEKLVASLFYEFEPVINPNVFNFLDQKSTTVLTDNGDGTYTYQWPSDTPILPGDYKVRYQTYDTTTPNPVWNSLEGTEDGFTIGNPPPITFSATKGNDVYCKNGSDGAIQLAASGGVGNFKYELNNSNTWIPFTASNMHTINDLPKGTKTIKVQDDNGCTEKE